MTDAELAVFCQDLADAVMDGRMEDASHAYAYPLALYIPGGMSIEASKAQTIAALTARRGMAVAHGATSIAASISHIDRSRSGRIVLDVMWTYLAEGGLPLDHTDLRYYCIADHPKPLKIELIEIGRFAFEESFENWTGAPLRH